MMVSKSYCVLPFRNRADAGSNGPVGDAASVGLNRQLHSRVPILIGDAAVSLTKNVPPPQSGSRSNEIVG